jgi:hypothetical protein
VEGSAGKDLVVVDRAGARLFLLPNLSERPSSRDDDRNGVPDDCERPEFHRGDVNGDSDLDISDPVRVLEFLFLDLSSIPCLEAADGNGDALVDISDAIFLLGHLFLGGEPPSDPGPPSSACGPDPDVPGSPGDLGCGEYTGCREEPR